MTLQPEGTIKLRAALCLSLLFVLLAQTLFFYPQLPDPMASDFGGHGNVQGRMPKLSFVILFWGLTVFLLLCAVLVPQLVRRMPVRLINLTNKDYWLAPEHRAETAVFFSAWMLDFAMATQLLLLVVLQLTFQANLAGPGSFLSAVLVVALAGYLAFVAAWIYRLARKFAARP